MMKRILPLALVLLGLSVPPAHAEDAQGFKARLTQALSAWSADTLGEGKLSFAEPLLVQSAPTGGFTVKVSELAWLVPISSSNRATIDFGPSEFNIVPGSGGWTVSGHVSDLVRFVAGGQVRATAKIARNRIDGVWDDKRQVFTKLKVDLDGLGIDFASGDTLAAAKASLTATSPDESFQGFVDLTKLQGYRAQDRTQFQIDQGRLDLAQKPLKGIGRLNFSWRHQAPPPNVAGAPQEVNPVRLNLKGTLDPFDWRAALKEIAPAAADGQNPFGKALWARIEPILHKDEARLALTEAQAQSVSLQAKAAGSAKFPAKSPITGSFNAKISGVQERLKGLSGQGSAGLFSSMAVLGILAASGIPDGKGNLDYQIDIAPDGQLLLNGKKTGGLLPKL